MKKRIFIPSFFIPSFMALGICFFFARCDNNPASNPTPVPPTPGPSLPTFTYKAAVVGSSGNMDISITPGDAADSTKTGEGSVTLTLDGEVHTMSSEDVADWDHGTELKDAMFSTPSGDAMATISVDKDGENPEVDLTVTDHEGIKAGVFDGGDDVSVYEGSYRVTYKDTDELQKLETFNMIIKGDEFIIMIKTSEWNEKICFGEQIELQMEVGVFSGTVEQRPEDEMTLVLTAKPVGSGDHPAHEGKRFVNLTKSGDTYTGTISGKNSHGETTELTSCRGKGDKGLILDNRQGYDVEYIDTDTKEKFIGKGFDFRDDGDGQKTPLDKDGNPITEGDPKYYTEGYFDSDFVPLKTVVSLKKTL